MDSKRLKHISKTMSLALRHKPELFGIVLDKNGWTDTQKLLEALKKKIELDLTDLQSVVFENDKQRFAFNDDQTRIRASQGHSVSIDLDLQPTQAPPILLHGTVQKNKESIQKNGLWKGKRNHVHLSKDQETAQKVALRHGKDLLILQIDAKKMQEEGFLFFLSQNGVWLTDHVPSRFIVFSS